MSSMSFLASVPGFDSLEPSWLRAIDNRAETVKIAAGQPLLRKGESGDRMYVLRSGTVEVPVVNDETKTTLIVKLGPKDIVGEMALLTGEPRVADVVAVTDVEAVAIRREDLDPILHANPAIARLLTEMLGRRLQEGLGIQKVGKYRFLRKIGRGASSSVFAALQKDLDRVVAAKMLNHSLVYQGVFRDRFLAEARTIAELDHPNIVQVIDVEEAYATFFIFMELLRGEDLAHVLYREKKFTPEFTALILRQVGQALRYAHEHHIVHRDVKPANCAVTQDGRVKLMDFGIASRIDPEGDAKGNNKVSGTPRYLAPETIAGKAVDGRADIYAMGVMACEMVTGKAPFRGKTNTEMMQAHMYKEPPDIRASHPQLPDKMIRFIEGTLVKERGARLSDWDTILALLEPDCRTVDPMKERLVHIRYPEQAAPEVDRALDELQASVRGYGMARVSWADLGLE